MIGDLGLRETLVDLGDDLAEVVLTLLELFDGKRPDQNLELDLGDVPGGDVGVEVGLAALGGLGQPAGVDALDDGGGDPEGVDQLVLGVAGVDVVALDEDDGGVGAEGLVLDLAEVRAVEGVGVVGAEGLDVEVLGAAADLLVGGEGDADRAVEELGVVLHPGHRGHDLGDAGLVVGAEQGGAVGVDERVADDLGQVGVVGDLEHLVRR